MNPEKVEMVRVLVVVLFMSSCLIMSFTLFASIRARKKWNEKYADEQKNDTK